MARRGELALLLSLGFLSACSRQNKTQNTAEPLTQHRNLGKAFYENPGTQQQAVQEFQQALQLSKDSAREKLNYALALLRASGHDEEAVRLLQEVQRQDPTLPHTWFNLGVYYKRQGDAARAIAQFEGMVARAPEEAIGHYQLGAMYRQQNRNAEAQAQFERAAQLDPQLAAAPFQLYNLYRLSGDAKQAAHYLDIFQSIQKVQKAWVTPEDTEWCRYAEIYDPPPAPATQAAAPEPASTDTKLDMKVDPATAGMVAIDVHGTGQTDLLVWSSQNVRLFESGRQARAVGLEDLPGAIDIAPGDFDNDGLMDLCVLTATGPLLYRNTGGRFVRMPAKLPARRFERAVWLDYDHDYDLDLVLLGDQPALLRNQGAAGWEDRTADFPFVKGTVTAAAKTRVDPESKAFDLAVWYKDRAPVMYRDLLGGRFRTEESALKNPPKNEVSTHSNLGDENEVSTHFIFGADGSLHSQRNTAPSGRWIGVRLTGVRSLKLAQDALVEIKAGSLYRREMYTGVPLVFDVGDRQTVDTVRITWPNGLIQNEVRQATNQSHAYTEAQRLSGSCPMIWTWNGHEVQFITDVLGVAPLGASSGDGSFFPVNHTEYVSIPGASLSPRDGLYDVRVTEELSEVSYIDQIRLYAVDHRAGTEIFTGDKFKSPPYPEFRLFNVEKRIYPQSAHDDQGRDVLDRVTAKDSRYPDQFARSETGVAALHTLDLDFAHAAASGKAVLLLNGWVDWPDGSTFRRASQESAAGLVMPYLQVEDTAGRWKTVDADMGMPAGKPKTIAVPVEFLSAGRKIRIVTNLCIYWDEIFLSDESSDGGAAPKLVPLISAELHFRGFSEARIDAKRTQPDTFFYDRAGPASFWNPTPGLYTRFGPVDALLREVDDQMVLMGSGDEMRLQFDSASLAAPRAGWTRDFLLKVDGWAKDRDPNTAFSASVLPLPFHAMSQYPYPAGEQYPRDAAHDQYQRTYNTRAAEMSLKPLESR